MATMSVGRELLAIRERTQRIVAVSAALHLIVGWAVLQIDFPTEPELLDDTRITEITWIDPVPVATAASNVAAPEPVLPPEESVVTDAAPRQAMSRQPAALTDRLAALRSETDPTRSLLTNALEAKVEPRALVGTLAQAPRTEARELQRGGEMDSAGDGARPLPTTRAIHRATVDVAAIARPAEANTARPESRREIQPGISLEGPVSGRPLVRYDAPDYPDWARRDGVEVTVELSFTVLPSGQVKENIRVERTSGYRDFDERAQTSLRQWRFARLGGGATGEQWGRIEFNYRLKQAG